MGFQQRWVWEHVNDAHGLGKPLVVEEFGKQAKDDDHSRRTMRDPHFKSLFDIFSSQRRSGGALKGMNCAPQASNVSFNDHLSCAHEPKRKGIVDFVEEKFALFPRCCVLGVWIW